VTPQHQSRTHQEDPADNQAHDQQTDAGPTAGERGIQASQLVPRPDYWSWRWERKYPTGRRVGLFGVGGDGCAARIYSWMIPLFRPMIAACVRSLASSFARMLLTRPLTVCSVTPRSPAISLFAFPAAMRRNTASSAGVSVSSLTC